MYKRATNITLRCTWFMNKRHYVLVYSPMQGLTDVPNIAHIAWELKQAGA